MVCQLISDHAQPRLTFDGGYFKAEVDVDEDIVELIDILSQIERNFTKPRYDRLSALTDNVYKFREELAPFILELELKGSERR